LKVKFGFILLLFVFACFDSYSQTADNNSLKEQLLIKDGGELISSLCHLGESLLDSIPGESFYYFTQANNLADSLQDKQGKKLALYSLGNYFKTSGDFTNAKKYFDSSNRLNSPEDLHHQILILIGYGEIKYELLQYDSAVLFLGKARNLALAKNDTHLLAPILNNLARVNDKLGNRHEAIEYYLQASRIFEQLKDHQSLAVAYNNIGTINLSFQNYTEAIYYFFEALKLINSKSLSRNLSMIYSNIGVAYYNLDSVDKASVYYKKSLRISKKNNHASDIARTFLNLGNLYSHLNEFNEAIRYYDSSLIICREQNIEYGILLNKINLGELYYNLGKYEEAAGHMENALGLISRYNLPEEQTELHLMLYKVYKKLGNESLALHNFESHHSLRDSIAGARKNEVLLELQARYENEKKQRELADLQKAKLEAEGKYRFFIIVFLLAVLTLLLLSFFFVFQRRRAVYHKKLAEKDNEMLKSEMNTKDRELANFALHLARTYETNAHISEEIKSILPVSDKSKSNQLYRIIHHLESGSSSDVWKEFEVRFEQVHKDFFYVLRELCPELSPVEIKVCSLLRLNMNSKDIAALTNRSVRTIENTRTIIRKKLQLSPQTNLTSYLLSI
jgi:tetratricopeptide (TPR) repeat protein/DNA-binding CsgD family transcriptional regulator